MKKKMNKRKSDEADDGSPKRANINVEFEEFTPAKKQLKETPEH